jgi:monoamine oxidase
MARSPLFSRLRRLVRRAHQQNIDAGRVPAPPEATGPSRRRFLEGLGALAVVPLVPKLAGCGDDGGNPTGTEIAIIGGGMAGLAVAHYLEQAGVRTTVYEGSMRPGGRMFTQKGAPLQGDQLVELGGELVDSNHVVIPTLCMEYGLTLDDLVTATPGLKQDIFYFNGAELVEADIVTAFTPVAEKMAIAVASEEDETEFERIDNLTIPQWLEQDAMLPDGNVLRELLEVAYLEEYGLEVEMQSAWNLLYLIDSETPDPFRIFGDSDERFHIHEGSGALPEAIATRLGDQVVLDHKLTKVVQNGAKYTLTFMSAGAEVVVEVDHVVYALPFTKLREVDLTASGLSEDKLTVITEMGYGTNAKLMMQFTARPWETMHNSNGSVITDHEQLQSTWATSRGQAGPQGILTNFVGGNRGVAMGTGDAESQAAMVLPWIDTIFAGTSATYIAGSAIRQHWPSYEWTKGSYACYRPGQWAFYGTEGIREGNQHFCGEHCSEDFQGYMEGAAETGALVAAEICDDLDVSKPDNLDEITRLLVSGRTRASYHGRLGERGRARIAASRARRALVATALRR